MTKIYRVLMLLIITYTLTFHSGCQSRNSVSEPIPPSALLDADSDAEVRNRKHDRRVRTIHRPKRQETEAPSPRQMKKRKVVKTEPAAEPHSETDESELDVSSDDEEEETLTTPKPIKKKTVKRVQISGVNKPQKIAEITASNPLSPSQATSHQMPPSPPPLPQVSTKPNRIFPISANELLQGKNALKKSSTPGTTERPKPKTTSDDDEFSEDSDS